MHHHTRKKRNHNKSKGGKKNNSVKIGGFLWNKQSTTGEFNNDTLNMFATVNKLLEIKKTNKNYLDRNNYDTIINIIDEYRKKTDHITACPTDAKKECRDEKVNSYKNRYLLGVNISSLIDRHFVNMVGTNKQLNEFNSSIQKFVDARCMWEKTYYDKLIEYLNTMSDEETNAYFSKVLDEPEPNKPQA